MADDPSPDPASPARLLALTAQIVSAQVRGNKVGAAELPGLIRAVRETLESLGQAPAEAEPSRPTPAVPVRRSVRPDAVTCLECGVRLKTLKRHLATDHGLTPGEYRTRWGLPAEYPMVAPDYAAARSGLAKRAGLGRKRTAEPEAATVEEVRADDPGPGPEPAPEAAPPPDEGAAPPSPKRRGRRKGTADPAAG